MKSLTQHIQEKLVINNNSKVINYHPKTKDELVSLIKDEVEKNGWECNLNDINTSEITDMSYLFSGGIIKGYKLSDFNGDISKWDVSNVTDMIRMFENSKFNGDISNWDVSKVYDMRYMFSNSEFNGDISEWDVSSVKQFDDIFNRCPIKEEYKPKFKK